MLQRLEITNFENHKHTVIDSFDAGFNLICGPSNAGKSSIIRALRLLAYNEWDPRSLRLGTKKCKLKVTTERGTVQVERGTNINNWEVTPVGGKTQYFSKPGKAVIPEAADIIGLRVVQLGNFSIRPNVMDQLEGHFLLAEMDGDDISGSVRAQIIDEISGLAGMEELIRQVGLDNVRTSREIKQTESLIKSLEEQLHDRNMIDRTEKLLVKIEGLIEKAKEGEKLVQEIQRMDVAVKEANRQLADDKAKLMQYPDIDSIVKKLEVVTEGATAVHEMSNSLDVWKKAVSEQQANKKKSQSFPNLDECERLLTATSQKRVQVVEACQLVQIHLQVSTALKENQQLCETIGDTSAIETMLKKAHESHTLAREAVDMHSKHGSGRQALNTNHQELNRVQSDLRVVKKELDKAIQSIEICPICLNPVHPGCAAFHRHLENE